MKAAVYGVATLEAWSMLTGMDACFQESSP